MNNSFSSNPPLSTRLAATAFAISILLALCAFPASASPRLGAPRQLTKNNVHGGWGIFTPDDRSIVYFQMSAFNTLDEFFDTPPTMMSVYKINLSNLNSEELAVLNALRGVRFNYFFNFPNRAQWLPQSPGAPPSLMFETLGSCGDDVVTLSGSLQVNRYDFSDVYASDYWCNVSGLRLSPDGTHAAYVTDKANMTKDYNYYYNIVVMPSEPRLSGERITNTSLERTAVIDLANNVRDSSYRLDDWSAGNVFLLTETPRTFKWNPRLSDWRNYIIKMPAFNPASRVMKIDIDGNGKEYLADHACCGSFSPDGKYVIYTDTLDGELWIVDADGGAGSKLTSNHNWKFAASWSNAGTQITWTELKPLEGSTSYNNGVEEKVQRFALMIATISF